LEEESSLEKSKVEADSLRLQLEYAKWLFDTDMRISENLDIRASAFLAFVIPIGAALAGYLATSSTSGSVSRAVQLLTNRLGGNNSMNFLNVFLFTEVITALLWCVGCLMSVFLLEGAPSPFPTAPTQLTMLKHGSTELEILNHLARDVIEAISPPEDEFGEFFKLPEELEQHKKLRADNGAPSLWGRNSKIKHRLSLAAFSFILTGLFFILILFKLAMISK
jgi:hypothetical protein